MHKYCVFVKKFSLLALILFLGGRVHCQVIKCCSEDSVLDIENDNFCESTANKTVWDAYNLPVLLIANCSVSRNIERNESFIELNGCIDTDKNGQYVAVSCSQDVDSITGVHLMDKCCPVGQSYDYSHRYCIKDANSHLRFEHVFGQTAVVLKNNVPNCSKDEVFVEYFSTVHSIKFDGKNMSVNGNTLLPDKFCIEDLINTYSVGINESHIIIRSCRPRSICEQIPCMRRCCKADEVMEPKPTKEGYKICHSHPDKMNLQPKFYNVSLPLDNSQKQVVVKGMQGMITITIQLTLCYK